MCKNSALVLLLIWITALLKGDIPFSSPIFRWGVLLCLWSIYEQLGALIGFRLEMQPGTWERLLKGLGGFLGDDPSTFISFCVPWLSLFCVKTVLSFLISFGFASIFLCDALTTFSTMLIRGISNGRELIETLCCLWTLFSILWLVQHVYESRSRVDLNACLEKVQSTLERDHPMETQDEGKVVYLLPQFRGHQKYFPRCEVPGDYEEKAPVERLRGAYEYGKFKFCLMKRYRIASEVVQLIDSFAWHFRPIASIRERLAFVQLKSSSQGSKVYAVWRYFGYEIGEETRKTIAMQVFGRIDWGRMKTWIRNENLGKNLLSEEYDVFFRYQFPNFFLTQEQWSEHTEMKT